MFIHNTQFFFAVALQKPRLPQRKQAPRKRRPVKKESLIDEKSDWNGTMFPFRGTAALYEEEHSDSNNSYDDDEWESSPRSVNDNNIKLNNALGALMSAYNSSDDSEVEALVPENDSDDEPPVEEKIVKEASVEEGTTENTSRLDENVIVNGCKPAPVKSTTRKRKRKHLSTKRKKMKKRNVVNVKPNENKDNVHRPTYRKRSVTLLEKLLESEIRHERNVLLQCVRYVVRNNFFLDTDSSRTKN